jgi:hypothetical protein
MPERTEKILKMLGAKNISLNNHSTGLLKPGQPLGDGKSPFPRIIL